MRSITPFDIGELECEALLKLFEETTSHIQDIQIERVTNGKRRLGQEEHPAVTLGLTVQTPTIRFADSLNRRQQIEAIAHELVHILLVSRYGLRMIDRRIHHLGSNQDIFDYFLNLNKHWNYFLEQTVNTIHHRILIDYLKEKYGIASPFHLTLFRHNFNIVSKSLYQDKESQYAKGLVAFEYEKLTGKADRAINPNRQSEFFWRAYYSAQKNFGGYHFRSIPTPSVYEEDILSFLEVLGYKRRDFRFVPSHSSSDPFPDRIA